MAGALPDLIALIAPQLSVSRLTPLVRYRRTAGRREPQSRYERIGHANVGFFLETYAHVLDNDDREAAEQAASLLGGAWESDGEDNQN